jgi:hypothetical protein
MKLRDIRSTEGNGTGIDSVRRISTGLRFSHSSKFFFVTETRKESHGFRFKIHSLIDLIFRLNPGEKSVSGIDFHSANDPRSTYDEDSKLGDRK